MLDKLEVVVDPYAGLARNFFPFTPSEKLILLIPVHVVGLYSAAIYFFFFLATRFYNLITIYYQFNIITAVLYWLEVFLSGWIDVESACPLCPNRKSLILSNKQLSKKMWVLLTVPFFYHHRCLRWSSRGSNHWVQQI